jgi:crotonobetainyl-CoA:carnitine CoA-transferase CaiB-like acyl-CoA transferase
MCGDIATGWSKGGKPLPAGPVAAKPSRRRLTATGAKILAFVCRRARWCHLRPSAKILGLDPDEYNYEACSRDAAAVNSEKGGELDRRPREYCAARTRIEVETELNNAQIGCARIFDLRDQYADEHSNAREMTVPVLDRQSDVPIRVYGVVPKMSLTPGRVWRGAPSIGDDTTDILSKMLGMSKADIDRLYRDEIVHRTEPFTTPQVDAINP